MKAEDLNCKDVFFEDKVKVIGNVEAMTPDPFCNKCNFILEQDEIKVCRACLAL